MISIEGWEISRGIYILDKHPEFWIDLPIIVYHYSVSKFNSLLHLCRALQKYKFLASFKLTMHLSMFVCPSCCLPIYVKHSLVRENDNIAYEVARAFENKLNFSKPIRQNWEHFCFSCALLLTPKVQDIRHTKFSEILLFWK